MRRDQREQKEPNIAETLAAKQQALFTATQPRFVGGGFALVQPISSNTQ